MWPGKAPGSEGWTQHETELGSATQMVVRNVVDPTLTAYFPPAGKANGAAMIVFARAADFIFCRWRTRESKLRVISTQLG